VRARRIRALARAERGSAIVEGLLALGLVSLAFAVGVQAVVIVQTRAIATAAAQAGVRAGAVGGTGPALDAAGQVLDAGGQLGTALVPSVADDGDTVTASVTGPVRTIFALGLDLPPIVAVATAPAEGYPQSEQAVGG
jgi:hypothetical protein